MSWDLRVTIEFCCVVCGTLGSRICYITQTLTFPKRNQYETVVHLLQLLRKCASTIIMIIPAIWMPSRIVFASLDSWSHSNVLDVLGLSIRILAKKKIIQPNSTVISSFNSTQLMVRAENCHNFCLNWWYSRSRQLGRKYLLVLVSMGQILKMKWTQGQLVSSGPLLSVK